MVKNPNMHNGLGCGDASPDRVIKHMMALADYAEMHGFAGFETKLLEAVEAFLSELNQSDRPAASSPVVERAGNVVSFLSFAQSAQSGAMYDGGRPC